MWFLKLTAEKKTINSRYGLLEVPKTHLLCVTPQGFKATPYRQEQCVYMGQQLVFSQSSETLEKLTGRFVLNKLNECAKRMENSGGYLLNTR